MSDDVFPALPKTEQRPASDTARGKTEDAARLHSYAREQNCDRIHALFVEEAPALELRESRQLAIAYAFGCIVFQLEEFRILPCSSDPATCSACDYNSRSLILNMREYLHAALDGRIPDEVP